MYRAMIIEKKINIDDVEEPIFLPRKTQESQNGSLVKASTLCACSFHASSAVALEILVRILSQQHKEDDG